MKKIPLSQGKFALIDDEDFEMVSLFKWCAYKGGDTFYAQTRINIPGEPLNMAMHRLIGNFKPHEQTDHKDRNGLNNQKANLRICNHSQNQWNRKSIKITSSKYKGVHWSKLHNKWTTQIMANGKPLKHITIKLWNYTRNLQG